MWISCLATATTRPDNVETFPPVQCQTVILVTHTIYHIILAPYIPIKFHFFLLSIRSCPLLSHRNPSECINIRLTLLFIQCWFLFCTLYHHVVYRLFALNNKIAFCSIPSSPREGGNTITSSKWIVLYLRHVRHLWFTSDTRVVPAQQWIEGQNRTGQGHL